MATPLDGHPPVSTGLTPVQSQSSTHTTNPSTSSVDARSTSVATTALTPPEIQPLPPAPLSSHTATNQTNVVKDLPKGLRDGREADAKELQAIQQSLASSRLKLGVIGGTTVLAVGLGACFLFFGPVGWALGGCIIAGSLAFGGKQMYEAYKEVSLAEGKDNAYISHPGHRLNYDVSYFMQKYEDDNFLEFMQERFGATPLDIMNSEPDRLKVRKAMNEFEIGIAKDYGHQNAIDERLELNRDIDERLAKLGHL